MIMSVINLASPNLWGPIKGTRLGQSHDLGMELGFGRHNLA